MIEPDEALARVIEHSKPRRTERLPIADALGLILAESVIADRDYPPFDRAMMDGVAVRLADAGKTVVSCGEVAAGQASALQVTHGKCVDIMTGAPCPEGTEAVLPEEEVERRGDRVTLPGKIRAGMHVVSRGDECMEGAEALCRGDEVTSLAIGMLASIGCDVVQVWAPPEVAVIITGKEVLDEEAGLETSKIRDANGPMLAALISGLGAKIAARLHADDTPESLATALERSKDSDIILLTGGVSAGKYDLVPGQLEQYGAEILFQKVRQKPGKPLLFARKGSQLIFGLPGNPLAVHFCFHRYAAAAVRNAMGKGSIGRAQKGKLAQPLVYRGKRSWFMPARADLENGFWHITPVTPVSTADLFNTHRADCYLHVPAGVEQLDAGREVEFTGLIN